jgi:hypothetical protein
LTITRAKLFGTTGLLMQASGLVIYLVCYKLAIAQRITFPYSGVPRLIVGGSEYLAFASVVPAILGLVFDRTLSRAILTLVLMWPVLGTMAVLEGIW